MLQQNPLIATSVSVSMTTTVSGRCTHTADLPTERKYCWSQRTLSFSFLKRNKGISVRGNNSIGPWQFLGPKVERTNAQRWRQKRERKTRNGRGKQLDQRDELNHRGQNENNWTYGTMTIFKGARSSSWTRWKQPDELYKIKQWLHLKELDCPVEW